MKLFKIESRRAAANAGDVLKKTFRWLFGKKEKDIYTSDFMTRRIRFESEKGNLGIKVSGEIIAKTPATFSNRTRVLKIIVARDKIKPVEHKARRK